MNELPVIDTAQLKNNAQMKTKFRLLFYILLFAIYYLLIVGILKLGDKLGIDNLLISVGTPFSIINSFVNHYLLKAKLIYDLLTGIAISYLSLYLCFWIGNFEPFPSVDPYGVITAIISNILLSIIFLEVAFRIKHNFSIR